MNIKQNTSDNPIPPNLATQLADLADEVKDITQEIEKTNKGTAQDMDDIEKKVDVSINNVEQIHSDLDQLEKDSSDELDKLILEQSEDLESE